MSDTEIKEEKCDQCDNVEEKMTTILVVNDMQINEAKRLCKDCVELYLASRELPL